MKIALIIFLITISCVSFGQPSEIGLGQQPQLSLDSRGIIRLVYGQDDKIFYSVSIDKGSSFSKPIAIAEVSEMHLGMTRGPQLASSLDYSVVTAIDKKGNIHSFQLDHKTNVWKEVRNVNDIEGSGREGLMSVVADDANNFYAVWLDLREDKRTKIAFSTLTGIGSWSRNKIVYRSPEKTVCECCKPSVAVRGKIVSVMFRNWLNGSRDLYLATSSNSGVEFGNAVKLGIGTWKLNGCPMDGGGILIDKKNVVHTVWQREGVVYYDQPGQSENRISEGRSCNLFGNETPFLTWQEGSLIFGRLLGGDKISVGEGTAATAVQLKEKIILAAWEKEDKIFYQKFQ